MTKKIVPPEFDLFMTNFVGENVRIYTRLIIQQKEDNGKILSETMSPLVVTGTLLDYDDRFLYLGSSPNSITQAVLRDEVRIVQVEETFDPLLEYLEGVEIEGEIQ